MNALSTSQLRCVMQYIQKIKPHQALQAELLDHVASLIEQRMDGGQPFETAFEEVTQQASTQALIQLKRQYDQAFGIRSGPVVLPVRRGRLPLKRRPATRPFQYLFFSSILSVLILISFLLLVSRPMGIPISTFRIGWVAGCMALLVLLAVRWWQSRQSAELKRTTTI